MREQGTRRGDVAQLVEHLLCKQGVRGSSPLISTIKIEFVDPSRWFSTWARKLQDQDNFRFAALVSNAASNIVGPYTPARTVVLDMTGFIKASFTRFGKTRNPSVVCASSTRLVTIYEFLMPN